MSGNASHLDDHPGQENQWAVGWHSHNPSDSFNARLNALRAGVLGANDGILSTAGLVVGVAGATSDRTAIVIAGIAGLAAGAMSMAAGEYVSVSTQRDSEKAMLAYEARELERHPEQEFKELVHLLELKGMSPETAVQAAREMTEHDAIGTHADIELGLDPDDLASPTVAAVSSFFSFAIGALLPLLVIALAPKAVMVLATAIAVALALALTGFLSAKLGRSPIFPAMARNVIGGAVAMGVTNLIGMMVGARIG